MEVYNVLFKCVENHCFNPFVQAFLKEEDAREHCHRIAKNYGLEIRSSFGWDDNRTMDDYRMEDRDGNSYYTVIFRQNLK